MKSVVLIDDVPIANFIMKKMIALLAPGTSVTEFSSPHTALEQLPLIKPDLVFLDLNMPEMSGYEFLDAMQEKNMHFDIIVLSSSTNQADKKKSSAYKNVRGYYSKPLEKETLKKILME